MKRSLFPALALMILATSVGACSWAGKTTGKAVNAVEQGTAEFEQGYRQERAAEDPEQTAE